MRRLNVMDEVRRQLWRRGFDPRARVEARASLRKRALEISLRVPYGVATVERILEDAPAVGIDDVEEFLLRCARANLEPIGCMAMILRMRRLKRSGQPHVRTPQRRRPSPSWIAIGRVGFLGATLWCGFHVELGQAEGLGIPALIAIGSLILLLYELRGL